MSNVEPGKAAATFSLPIPMDALRIIGEAVERIYGTGETSLRTGDDVITVMAPQDGFGPLKRGRGRLPGSVADDMKLTAADIRDGRISISIEDHQNRVLVIAEAMRKWFEFVGGINYVEQHLQMPDENGHPTDIDWVFTLQRRDGLSPHEARQAAELRVAELEVTVAALEGKLAAYNELEDEYLLQKGDELPAGPVRATLKEALGDRDYVTSKWGARKIMHRRVTDWEEVAAE